MTGLRFERDASEPKFLPFFSLVQKAAADTGKVFFLDFGDGHEFENDEMEGEDLAGWLVPASDVPEFEPIWEADPASLPDKFSDMFCWAVWKETDDGLSISFSG